MSDNYVLPNSPNVYGPITPRQVFERTFGLLREDPKLFFGIAAVLMGFEIVIGGVLGGSGILVAHSGVGTVPITRMLVTFPLALLGALMIYVFMQIIQGALFLATQAKLAHASISVGEACQIAGGHVGRLVGISILVALRMFGYLLLFYFAAAILLGVVILMFGGFAHLAGGMRFQPGMHVPAQLLGAGAVAILLVLAISGLYLIVLLWLMARYAVSIPASLAENVSITEAIRRSIHLTRRSKGRLYALFIGMFAAYVVIAGVTIPVQLMILHAGAWSVATSPAKFGGITILVAMFEYIFGAIVLTFAYVGITLCYYDLRVRKEGFGAAPAAPALDLRPATPPPMPDWPIEDLPVS